MTVKKLSNGLRIILDKKTDMRSATLGVWAASGSRYEDDSNNGVSHFIEHMVFKATENRTAFEIAEGFDEIGASVNAYTTKEYTFFYTKALDYQILNAADILFEMITKPLFSEKDIETEKGVVLEEIAMCKDDPSDVSYETNESAVLSECSLRREILGSRESVSALTREKIIAYMKRFYVPERMIVGLCGSFDEDEIIKKIEHYFGSAKNTGFPLEKSEVPFSVCNTILKKDYEQNHLILSFNGVGIAHDDLYPLQAALFVLGTGSSSRLNQKIREQLGLVYDISAWLSRFLGGGYISIGMSLSSQSEEKALAEVCKIIKEFPETITEREIKIAKEKLTASLIMSREKPESLLSAVGYSLLMLGEFTDDDKIINSIRSVSVEDAKTAARKYLDLSSASFTAVGNVRGEDWYKNILKGYTGG